MHVDESGLLSDGTSAADCLGMTHLRNKKYHHDVKNDVSKYQPVWGKGDMGSR